MSVKLKKNEVISSTTNTKRKLNKKSRGPKRQWRNVVMHSANNEIQTGKKRGTDEILSALISSCKQAERTPVRANHARPVVD